MSSDHPIAPTTYTSGDAQCGQSDGRPYQNITRIESNETMALTGSKTSAARAVTPPPTSTKTPCSEKHAGYRG
jgi:hypothetical protein